MLDIGNSRLITDPTLDPLGPSRDGHPHRTTAPARNGARFESLDVALVSHDQHPDNLDDAGRELLTRLPLVLTTAPAAERLRGTAVGLAPWETHSVSGGRMRITALPALHGPVGADAVCGPVIGFHLAGDGLPSVYVSGDNASLDIVREIGDRMGPVDVALLFAGAASVNALMGGASLTLGSAEAVSAARILGAGAVVPLHCDGWTHYAQDGASLKAAFATAGLGHVLVPVADGEEVRL